MKERLELKQDLQVKKSEQLVYSRYKLTPLAQKLVATVISLVQEQDENEQEYCLLAKDFLEIVETKTNNRSLLIDACKELMSKPLEIKEDKGWLIVNWCSSIRYIANDGLIRFRVDKDLKPYILDLKNNYLKYDLKNILPLKSEYSIRVYEWLKDTYNSTQRYNKKQEVIFDLSFIRERLQVPLSYDTTKVFTRVLDKAKEDLEEHTDIKFNYEIAEKQGKAITKIKFTIIPNFDILEEMNKLEQLPDYLQSFMNFTNKLRSIYKDTQKYFMLTSLDLGDGKQSYYFGINKNDLIYAMPVGGGDSVPVNKTNAEIIYNGAYISAQHSKEYRNFIVLHKGDFWELSNDLEFRDYFKALAKELSEILSKNDPRIKPMF